MNKQMERELIALLKKDKKLLSIDEIIALAGEESLLKKASFQEIETCLKNLCKQSTVVALQTVKGTKYCFAKESMDQNIQSSQKAISPRIQEINKRIWILVAFLILILGSAIGILLTLPYADSNFTPCGIFLIAFLILNFIVGFLASKLGKIIGGINSWIDFNSPNAGDGCGSTVSGCGAAGCGQIAMSLVCGLYMFLGWLFAIICIQKLMQEKENIKNNE